MSDKRQRKVIRLMSTATALVISQPITDYIAERLPERQSMKDDLTEAAVQGLVWTVSIFVASLIVNGIVNRDQ